MMARGTPFQRRRQPSTKVATPAPTLAAHDKPLVVASPARRDDLLPGITGAEQGTVFDTGGRSAPRAVGEGLLRPDREVEMIAASPVKRTARSSPLPYLQTCDHEPSGHVSTSLEHETTHRNVSSRAARSITRRHGGLLCPRATTRRFSPEETTRCIGRQIDVSHHADAIVPAYRRVARAKGSQALVYRFQIRRRIAKVSTV